MSDKFVCLYILKITMNEWKSIYRKKKNIFQQNNFNLFAVLIGFMISITFFAYSQAKQQDYQIPTGNNYAVSSTWKFESVKEVNSWEHKPITIKNQWTWRSENVVAWTRKIESWWNWSVEKVNSWWSKLALVNGFAEDSLATMVSTYAYELDNARRKDFLIMMKCENGNFDIHLQSSVPDTNWPNWREDSRGLCQLNRTRHSEVVDNPLFRNDWKRQVEQCYKKRVAWTKFYWPNRPIYKNKKYIGKCSDVVKNDFTLISK